MNRTWLLLIVAGLVLTSCMTESPKGIVNLPDVPSDVAPAPSPKPEVVPNIVPLIYGPKEFTLGASESEEYSSKLFTVLSISRDAGVQVDVDGSKGVLVETKNFEVINGLKVTLLKFDYSDLNKARANIALEEFKLGNNEYLINSGQPLAVNNVNIKLKEVGSDFVFIEVGTGSAEKILLNNEKGFSGVRIKLLHTFYKDTTRQPYAWVLILPE